jgi:hypothetical protein
MIELFKDFGVPLSVAFIAALASVLGLIISKESKVSEFRQAWIDGLRCDIAALIGHTAALQAVKLMKIENNDRLSLSLKHFLGVNEMASKIRLRLNPKKKSHRPVLNALEKHESFFSKPVEDLDYDGIEKAEERLISQGQILLKMVWEEVKVGELTYRVSRASFIVLLIASIVSLVALTLAKLCK